MIKRVKTGLGVVAGLSALALGGSAIASAAGPSPPPTAPIHESVAARDTDNIQSGDQTSPDHPATDASSEVKAARDVDNVQQGSQTGPDGPRVSRTESSSAENAGETSGESTLNGDGPGGYADPVGNPNADTQQQGQH